VRKGEKTSAFYSTAMPTRHAKGGRGRKQWESEHHKEEEGGTAGGGGSAGHYQKKKKKREGHIGHVLVTRWDTKKGGAFRQNSYA